MSTESKSNGPTPGDFYLQFMFGWHHGVGRKPIDEARSQHKNQELGCVYLEGYNQGQEEARKSARKAARRFGYQPSIIRIA